MNLPEPIGTMIAATSEGLCGVCSEPLLPCGWCRCCERAMTATNGVFLTLDCQCVVDWRQMLLVVLRKNGRIYTIWDDELGVRDTGREWRDGRFEEPVGVESRT